MKEDRRFFLLKLAGALCTGSGACMLLTACCADGISVTAAPMTVELNAEAGGQQTGVLTIKHEASASGSKANAPVHLRVYAMDWTLDVEGNPQFSKAGNTSNSCSNWIQVNPVELNIPAGESQQVRYTLKVPAEAQGTYRSIIMFETDASPAQVSGQKVAINGRIGSAIYALVGTTVKRARITSFAVTPEKTTLTVENTGTSHVRLHGQIEFRDADKRLLAQLPIPNTVVLPVQNNVRRLRLDTPSLPSGLPITVTATLDYGGDVLLGARSHVTKP